LEGRRFCAPASGRADDAIEDCDLGERQSNCRWGVRGGASHHGQPHNPSTDDAEHGDQIHQAIRGSQFGVFGAATGLQDFVEDLNLPTHSAPADLFDGLLEALQVEVGLELPDGGLSP
jgi:hypothetical protein